MKKSVVLAYQTIGNLGRENIFPSIFFVVDNDRFKYWSDHNHDLSWSILNTVKVEIFAHFVAKWSGAKIKPRKYYVKMCVCVCKLVVREIKNMRYSSFLAGREKLIARKFPLLQYSVFPSIRVFTQQLFSSLSLSLLIFVLIIYSSWG